MCKKSEFNHWKLRGLLREKGMTQNQLADGIGINKSSLSQKLNNVANFTAPEIFNICEFMEIKEDEIKTYFFTQSVCKTQIQNT